MIKPLFLYYNCLFLLLTFPLAASSVSASEHLETFLPSSSIAVLTVPNLNSTTEQFRLYAQMLPSINPLSPFLQKISSWGRTFEQSSGIPLAELASIFQTSCAIALFDSETPGNIRPPSLKFPAIFLAADVTNAVEPLQSLLQRVVYNHIQAYVPSVEFHIKTVQGINLWIILNPRFQCAYTFWDQIFLFTTHPEYLEHMLNARRCSVPTSCAPFKSLWNAEGYHAARNIISGADHDLRVYVNIAQLRNFLQPMYQHYCEPFLTLKFQWFAQFAEFLSGRSLIWLFSLNKQGGHERLFWEFDQAEQIHFKSDISQEPLPAVTNEILMSDRIVPGNVLYYQAWKINLSLWRQRCKRMIETLLSPNQYAQFSQQIQTLEQALPFDPEEDLLPTLEDEVAIACYDPTRWLHRQTPGASLENFPCLFLLSVRHQERLEQLLNSIPANLRSTTFLRGIQVFTLELPGGIVPLLVYGTFLEDFLIVSLSQQALQPVLAAAQQGGALVSQPDYRTLSASFAQQGIGRSYFNLSYFFRRFDSLHQDAVGKNDSLFASLTGIFSVTTISSSGMLTESFSTFGGTLMGKAIVALWALSL